jgi:DNA helicase HerA-like ATPase
MVDTSKIRVREHFGIATNETSTKQVRFLISPPKNRPSIQQQDIVLLDHPLYGDTCQIIAEVTEIASYEEVAGSSHSERLGKMLATAKILGYANQEKEDKPLQKLLAPPNPGSRIYMPYVDFLEDAFARDNTGKLYEQPLHLGNSENTAITVEGASKQVRMYVNGKNVLDRHTLVAAVTGTGKTNTVKVILEELTQKTDAPIVIVDPNGEYTNLATNYTVATVTPQTKTPKIAVNQVTILNGQTLSLKEKSEFFTNQIAALIKAKLEKTLPNCLLIVEDPENIGSDVLKEAVTSKLGLTAVLVTSHPTGLQANILSRMGNQIVGKTVDPTDIAYLKAMLNCTEQELASLGQGEFYVNSVSMPRPVKVQVKQAQA